MADPNRPSELSGSYEEGVKHMGTLRSVKTLPFLASLVFDCLGLLESLNQSFSPLFGA